MRGDPRAQTNLGLCYEDGDGVPRDWRRAVHWYRLAALQQHGEALGHLALLLGQMAMAAK